MCRYVYRNILTMMSVKNHHIPATMRVDIALGRGVANDLLALLRHLSGGEMASAADRFK